MRSRNEAIVSTRTFAPMEAWLEKARAIGRHCPPDGGGHLPCEAASHERFIMAVGSISATAVGLPSMKRQKKDQKAKIGVVKLRMDDEESFAGLVERINGQIKQERSGKKTAMDKELDLFGLVPTIGLRLAFKFFLVLDYFGLLPRWFIDGDGMFTSIFIANLGSIGMRPGYHHLYEWGNASIFITLGAVEDRVVFEGDR